jgi:hypothetical protein
MDTSDRGLSHTFVCPGTVANGLIGLKRRWWSVSSFFIPTAYTRALILFPDKKPEGLSQANVGAVPKQLFANMYFFHSLCEEHTLDIRPSTLGTPCIFSMQGTTFHTH